MPGAPKGIWRGPHSYPPLMIDTGHNFHEVTDFRDFRAKELGAELIVRSVEDSMASRHRAPGAPGREPQRTSRSRCSRPSRIRFDALIGGARRDEEKPAPRNASSATATASANGSPRPSAPSCGRCSTTVCSPASTSACSHQQLDRAGRVAVHRPREHCPALAVLHAHPRQVVERKACSCP